MTPVTLITLSELSELRRAWESAGETVAFVPTMGALHQGHLALVKQAKGLADRVIVSIFVNPTQFGPNEDFSRYPRTVAADMELLASQQVDAVFLPTAATMYPSGFQTYVHGKGMALELDGAVRPGHFEGVLTVVLKLFQLVRPQTAIFGKKDYQQWRLIERMAADLCLGVSIVGAEILREADGLAMSSRNRYLSETQRLLAPRLVQSLNAAKTVFAAGERQAAAVAAACSRQLAEASAFAIDYVELRRQQDLSVFAGKIDAPCVLLVAARLGTTRLIDNMEL